MIDGRKQNRWSLNPGVVLPAVLLFVLSFTPLLHAEKLYFDINSPFMRKIPVAILPMDTGGSFENGMAARKLTGVIRSDLEFQGFFSVSDQTDYSRLLASDWKKTGVEYVIRGKVSRDGENLLVELRLLDSSTGKMRTGRRYRASPSDMRIVAHRFCDLVVMEITGTRGVSLTRIFFIRKKGGVKAVYSADFDGFNPRREVNDRSINLSPSPSPDGRFLAYTSFASGRPCIYLKDMSTGKTRRISAHSGLNISPAWHPDSRSMAATFSMKGNPRIYQIGLDGGIIRQITTGAGINVSPSWSPDGEMIAFVSDRFGTPQIFVKGVLAGTARRITYSGSYNTEPSWSPDGRNIAYTGRVNGRFQIFVIPSTGGNARQLTFEGSNEHPSWSPDGRHIVFSTTRNGGRRLMVMLSDGRDKRLLPVNGEIAMPVWGGFAKPHVHGKSR
jgi:TolB protein